MSNTISSAAIRHILNLAEKRDELIAELAKVTGAIEAAVGGEVTKAPKGKRGPKAKAVKAPALAAKGKAKSKRLKHGSATELILNGLKAAGDAGISVKELAPKIGLKASTMRVWLGTTGKKLKEVEKIGWGLYRFVAAGPAPAPAPAKKVKKSGKKRAKN
ncbi:hypothetical protein BH09VER1_BH09VER1_48200 [soil metagenome]